MFEVKHIEDFTYTPYQYRSTHCCSRENSKQGASITLKKAWPTTRDEVSLTAVRHCFILQDYKIFQTLNRCDLNLSNK